MSEILPEIISLLHGRRIAISGHKGFVGSHVTRILQASGLEPAFILGDVREAAVWVGEFDLLFHFAGVLPDRFNADLSFGFSTNVQGTIQALEACRYREAQVVIPSTCAIYAPDAARLVSEKDPVKPSSPYSHSKHMAETICKAYASEYGIVATILRLFNVYGSGQQAHFIIPYLMACAAEDKTALIYNAKSSRDFVYVDDVASAFLSASKIREPYSVFNIGSGKSHTVEELIAKVSNTFGKALVWQDRSGRPEVHDDLRAGIQNARKRLAWVPETNLEAGLRAMVVR